MNVVTECRNLRCEFVSLEIRFLQFLDSVFLMWVTGSGNVSQHASDNRQRHPDEARGAASIVLKNDDSSCCVYILLKISSGRRRRAPGSRGHVDTDEQR